MRGLGNVFNEGGSDDISDSAVDNLTDGLEHEKDEKGRDREGIFVDPDGDPQRALDSLPGEPDGKRGKVLPDGSRAGLHKSTGESGGRAGPNTGSSTLHINRPAGKGNRKIRFTR